MCFGTLSLIAGLWDREGRQQHLIARRWAATLLQIARSPVEVIGGERLRNAPVAVFAANHLSYMDTPVVFAKLPFQFRILAKQGFRSRTQIVTWVARQGRPDG